MSLCVFVPYDYYETKQIVMKLGMNIIELYRVPRSYILIVYRQ